MRQTSHTIIPNLIDKHYQRLAEAWLATQKRDGVVGGQITEGQLAEQSRRFLVEFRKGAAMGDFDDISGPEWDSTLNVLNTVAVSAQYRDFRHRSLRSLCFRSRNRYSSCCARKLTT